MVFIAIVVCLLRFITACPEPFSFQTQPPDSRSRCQSNGAECQYKLSALWRSLSRMTQEQLMKRRLDQLAREYIKTHNSKIAVELYRLARDLEKMEEENRQSEKLNWLN